MAAPVPFNDSRLGQISDKSHASLLQRLLSLETFQIGEQVGEFLWFQSEG
jgi:hypothetical protein